MNTLNRHTSRPDSLETFPVDIQDHILLEMPDFDTMKHAVLSSKVLYATFQRRRSSILESIAENAFGSAWPCLLMAARCRQDMACLDDFSFYIPPATVSELPFKPEEEGEMEEMWPAAKKLEDLFSMREKDRTSTTSCLTRQETYRFQRALARFWIFTEMRHHVESSEWEVIYPQVFVYLPRPEQREMYKVWSFLAELLGLQMADKEGYPYGIDDRLYFMAALVSPPDILAAHEANDIELVILQEDVYPVLDGVFNPEEDFEALHWVEDLLKPDPQRDHGIQGPRSNIIVDTI